MKKVLTALLLIVFVAVMGVCAFLMTNDNFAKTTYTSLSYLDDSLEKEIQTQNLATIDAFFKVLDNAKGEAVASEYFVPLYDIYLKGEDNIVHYEVKTNIDESATAVIKSGEDKGVIVDESALDALLSREDFADLYADVTAPLVTATYDGEKYTMALTGGEFSVKRKDGQFYPKVVGTKGAVPTIKTSAISNIVFGFDITPDLYNIKLLQNGMEIFSGNYDKLKSFTPSQDGEYELVLDIIYQNEEHPYNANLTYRATIKYDSKIEFTFSADSVELGEVMTIYAKNVPTGKTINCETNLNFTPKFFEYNKKMTALLPINYNLTAGTYYIKFSVGTYSVGFDIVVDDKTFEVQHLVVSEETTSETIENNNANAEFDQKIPPIKRISDSTIYWEKPFIHPVEGRITTQFGMKRYVNDAKTPTRHSGIDIAAPGGTPIKASNAGRVVFAEYLQLTGNTVVIEHGFGLKTWYYHMSEIDVSVNDMLKQGDIIGKVGTTGFSTGNHLHFAMSVNNVFVNPWTSYETTFIDLVKDKNK